MHVTLKICYLEYDILFLSSYDVPQGFDSFDPVKRIGMNSLAAEMPGFFVLRISLW